MRSFIVPFMIVALVASTAGCSFSESSKSSSEVISSPFTSSSGSSADPATAYGNEVAEFTGSFVKSGGDLAQLRPQVGKIAQKRGISDWESNKATYVSLGKGLRTAGFTQAQFDGYKATLGLTSEQAQWMQEGFGQGK